MKEEQCGIATSRVFHLQTDQMCPTQCAQVQPPSIGGNICFSLLANKISFIGDLLSFLLSVVSISFWGDFAFDCCLSDQI